MIILFLKEMIAADVGAPFYYADDFVAQPHPAAEEALPAI